MADAFTNRGLCLQVTASNPGTWGSDLNVNDITITDSIVGTTQSLTLSSGTTAITPTQSQNLAFLLTGSITTDIICTLPFNLATGATTAVGGTFIFNNQTTGAHTVTVKTVAFGSTGVTVPQGLRAQLYSDATNVYYANDGGKAIGSSVIGYLGNPDGVVACTPASATTPADMLWDYDDEILYVCTGAPNTWSQVIPPAVTSIPTPACGYLTLSNSPTNPILTNDAVAQTTLYYTPYTGAVIGIPNGSTFSTYAFSQLTLALSATYQAANGIYDAFGFVNSGVAAVGFGPNWAIGGGSVTPGSCSRGTGAGSTQLSRLLGTLSNTVSITLNNGATTYSVGSLSAIYLGSISVDSSAGQVTCHTSYGQSRKWGVWNAYNRIPVYLKAGDPASSPWTYDTAAIRPSNNNTANSLTVFCGLAEEFINTEFIQHLWLSESGSDDALMYNSIGWNSTSVTSGTRGCLRAASGSAQVGSDVIGSAQYISPPSLGLNTVTSLEQGAGAGTSQWFGTELEMSLSASWLA